MVRDHTQSLRGEWAQVGRMASENQIHRMRLAGGGDAGKMYHPEQDTKVGKC